jgi:hypothetical protein
MFAVCLLDLRDTAKLPPLGQPRRIRRHPHGPHQERRSGGPRRSESGWRRGRAAALVLIVVAAASGLFRPGAQRS